MEISYSIAGSIALIWFDATIREDHHASAIVTELPVEKGVNVSDHVRIELKRFTVDAVVTNSPIVVPKSNLDGATGETRGQNMVVPVKRSLPIAVPGVGALLASAGALDGYDTINPLLLQFDDEFDRVTSVWNEINTLILSATLVNISTSVEQYENMVIKSVSLPRSSDDGDSGTFSFEVSEIRFVETKVVAVPKDKRAATKNDKGPQSPNSAPSDNKSLLWKMLH